MLVPPFKDPDARAAFERLGYVVVPALLAEKVPELVSVYEEMLRGMPPSDPYFQIPMTGTNCIGDPDLRRRICGEVQRIVAPRLETVLDGYRFVGAGFRVKLVGPDSRLPQHQDPTMVDEDRFWSINIIAPIIDTTAENGALQVVPGSHRIMPKVRSLDLEDRADTYHLHEVVDPLVRTVPLRAGDAIFYYNSLLHGSGPNMSAAPRPLVIGTLMSRESPMTLHFRKPEQPRSVERYEVPDDYFNRMELFDRDHRGRPQIGYRIADTEDTYTLTRDDMLAAFRSLAAELA